MGGCGRARAPKKSSKSSHPKQDEYAVKRADPAWVGAASEAELAAADFIARKSYEQLFVDLRKCVDLCHRDGVIKDRVAEDPARCSRGGVPART